MTKEYTMNKTLATFLTGGLSNPSKMPGFSYGLPAGKAPWVPALAKANNMDIPEHYGCNVGGKLQGVNSSTCNACYATKGMYYFKNVKLAQLRRANSIYNDRWVDAMAFLINSKRSKYFRWHDSGDIVAMWHLQKIVEVCKLTPTVKHWLPTREAKLIVDYENTHGAFPDNLTIRLSATKVDASPPTAWALTSTVHKDNMPVDHKCPAPTQGGECKDCRACWSDKVKNVSYHIH